MAIQDKKLAVLIPHPNGGKYETTVDIFQKMVRAFNPEIEEEEVVDRTKIALILYKNKLMELGFDEESAEAHIDTLLAEEMAEEEVVVEEGVEEDED